MVRGGSGFLYYVSVAEVTGTKAAAEGGYWRGCGQAKATHPFAAAVGFVLVILLRQRRWFAMLMPPWVGSV